MGIWSFKGGQIFTNDGQFKENTVKDIEVKNADSREIFLEDDISTIIYTPYHSCSQKHLRG